MPEVRMDLACGNLIITQRHKLLQQSKPERQTSLRAPKARTIPAVRALENVLAVIPHKTTRILRLPLFRKMEGRMDFDDYQPNEVRVWDIHRQA